MLGVEDESILVDFEEEERSSPCPRKIVGDRVIYTSRLLGIPKEHGRPILADFGEARLISTLGKQWEDVQPLIYRAPEVLLRMPWNEKIDIWNLGVLVCLYHNLSLVLPKVNQSYRPGVFLRRNVSSVSEIQRGISQTATTLPGW
jgi:serine/threonine protein kinase